MKYYRIIDELYSPEDRWFLGNFDNLNNNIWDYLKVGDSEIPNKKLTIKIREKGTPLDFTFADFELPVINRRVAELLDKNEVNLIPVNVNSIKIMDFYLLILKREFDCVDENNSVFDKWEENNKIRPDKSGQYKTFYKLIIKPDVVRDSNIFKIRNYSNFIIISDSLKTKLEKQKISGISYKLVS